MKVPVLELTEQYAEIKPALLATFERLFDAGQFILGPDVPALEQDLSRYLNIPHTIGVTSGTDALYLALKALGVGPGNKVLTSPFTFFATVSAIMNTGAEPVFADIDPRTFNLDPERAEEVLKKDTQHSIKVILPVHLYGQAAEMDAFVTLAEKYHCKIVEDAAQAIGTQYKGKTVGGIGHFGCFSFFPTKNLGALGDAGLVTTQDGDLAEAVRKLRTHGSQKKYYHERIGGNFRIDTLQAAFLRVMLPHLNDWLASRQRCANYYDEQLAPLQDKIEIPYRTTHGTHTFHQYTLRVKGGERESLRKQFAERQIGCAIYYPLPCHLQAALQPMGFSVGAYPESEKAADEALSIPIYPNLSREKQDTVIHAIREWTKVS